MTSEPDTGGRATARGKCAFRLLLVAVTACTWAVTGYFASHQSTHPVVLGRWSTGYAAVIAALTGVAIAATLAHLRPIFDRLARVRAPLVAIAFGSVMALALGEVAVRAADPLGISYYERAKHYQLDEIPDDQLQFRQRPNFRATYQGVEYRFNELGLRERPIGPKAADETRILLIGDSVTLGFSVPVEDTFGRRVEALLSRPGRHVRTINSGVGGYNTRQELAFLERDGDLIAPDALFVLYVYNDVDRNTPFEPQHFFGLADKNPPEVVETLLGRSWLYRLFAHVLRFATGNGGFPDPRENPGFAASMTSLRGILHWAERRRIPVAIAYWGTGADPAYDSKLYAAVGSIAAEHGVPLARAFDWLGGRDPMDLSVSRVDSHPNAEGHRLIAEGLAPFLERLITR